MNAADEAGAQAFAAQDAIKVVWIAKGGNEMGDESFEESTVVCESEERAQTVADDMEKSGEYDFADIFEMDVVP